jgi:hypothetical protein
MTSISVFPRDRFFTWIGFFKEVSASPLFNLDFSPHSRSSLPNVVYATLRLFWTIMGIRSNQTRVWE